MFLKSESLKWDGHTVMLFELSALQRIEHLHYMAGEEKKLPEGLSEQDLYPLLVARNIRVGARVVAMSLWQADITGPDVETLHENVMSTWSVSMIGAGELLVKKISDMLPRETAQREESDAQEEEEPVTAEKPIPVS